MQLNPSNTFLALPDKQNIFQLHFVLFNFANDSPFRRHLDHLQIIILKLGIIHGQLNLCLLVQSPSCILMNKQQEMQHVACNVNQKLNMQKTQLSTIWIINNLLNCLLLILMSQVFFKRKSKKLCNNKLQLKYIYWNKNLRNRLTLMLIKTILILIIIIIKINIIIVIKILKIMIILYRMIIRIIIRIIIILIPTVIIVSIIIIISNIIIITTMQLDNRKAQQLFFRCFTINLLCSLLLF
ncbi:unnamed protein product (macronuclear) [Paramecium tetraurelia]|uniref:Transmembrane protein n=1 Tax=Paramecium tetraurelia TaxID=5888 RepID=A0EHB7_PARTE|nr:uncharacterized protein GSPATT00027032001 [Paramecium tetraurelia]CAK94708.1 unnamed protein product [Paramecium tetraurelia]|eukprot:XP_001462081.1 hypothetical protein (macronuclear) [Paramecium tetraurelia strain d4-2]